MPEIGHHEIALWDGSAFRSMVSSGASYPNLRVQIFQGANQPAITTLNTDDYLETYLGLVMYCAQARYDGGAWDRVRCVDTLKPYYAAALATNTLADVWTPAAGKKFRLMGMNISSDCGAGKQIEVVDEAAVIMNIVSGVEPFEINFGPNGYLSAAADQDLKIRHQKGANAIMSVNAWGNEE